MAVAAVLILTILNQVNRCFTFLSSSPFLNILALHNSAVPVPTNLLKVPTEDYSRLLAQEELWRSE